MSCYKDLQIEIQELKRLILEMSLGVSGLHEQVRGNDWISVEELNLALSTIPIILPWD